MNVRNDGQVAAGKMNYFSYYLWTTSVTGKYFWFFSCEWGPSTLCTGQN